MNTLIKNKLYVVATPIGNLKDITFRAVEVLSGSDVILCEDTRITSVLLSHFNIDKKKLIVVNKDINKSSFSKIIDIIKNNVVSIVSDSGTPNLSDPASVIIDLCYNNNIPVEAIPGPSSIMAFYSSFPFGTRFMFYGFIDKISQQITEVIDLSRKIDSPVIIFVSPSKIEKFLHELSLKDADAYVYLSKELTKVHEFKKIFKAKDYEILLHFENFKINKGEYCLAIRSSNVSHNLTDLNSFILDNISLKTKELAQIVSDKFSISNSDAYHHVLAVKKNIQ